jgi:hypothetical protein
MHQSRQIHFSGSFYRNLRSSRGLLLRENNEGHEDEGVRTNEAGELNRSILLSCSSGHGRIKNEQEEEFHPNDFALALNACQPWTDNYKCRKQGPCARQNQQNLQGPLDESRISGWVPAYPPTGEYIGWQAAVSQMTPLGRIDVTAGHHVPFGIAKALDARHVLRCRILQLK